MLVSPAGLLAQTTKTNLNIVFIGNSITCGALADSTVEPCGMGAYHDHHDAYYAYGPRVARALDAEFTSIKAEIDTIGGNTTYNGQAIFTASTLTVFLSDSSAASLKCACGT